MNRRTGWMSVAAAIVMATCVAVPVAAQTEDSSWNAEVSVGWDLSLSGDFLAASIGTLNGLPAIIESQPFGDVFGNGLQFQFSGGYMVDEINEVRGQVSYQRVGADVTTLGTVAGTALVGTFDDYKAWTIEAGYRHCGGGLGKQPFSFSEGPMGFFYLFLGHLKCQTTRTPD